MKEEKKFLKGIVVALILICNVLVNCFSSFNISFATEEENEEISAQVNRRFDQTEVITSTSLIQNLLNPVSAITSIDLTGLVTGEDANHTHIYEKKYDDNNHWEECFICKSVINRTAHNLITTGTAGCALNYGQQKRYCTESGCGYNITLDKVAHTASEWISFSDRNYHTKRCTVCNQEIIRERCTNSAGQVLGCSTGILGTCVVCGANRNIALHSSACNDYHADINESYCLDCDKKMLSYTFSSEVLSANKVKYSTIVTLEPGVELITSNISAGNCSGLKGATYSKPTIVKNSDGTYTASAIVEYDPTIVSPGLYEVHIVCGYTYNGVRQNGTIHITRGSVKSDNTAPTYISANVDAQGTVNDWKQKAKITAKFSENIDSVVYMRILDSDQNTVLSDWETATEDSDIFTGSYDIVTEIYGMKKIYVQAKDRLDNLSPLYPIEIQYIDSQAPKLSNQTGNTSNWSKSKNIIYTATDYGVGNVSIAFNNQSDFQVATQNGTNYTRTYNFYGDVYGSVTGALYIKDALGNISTEKVTISNLDGTAPTIIGTSIKNNVITVTANDQRAGMGEGSGVASYRYIASSTKLTNPTITTSNSTQVTGKTTGTGTFTVDNIADANYIYVSAVDAVGNIGTAVEVPVPKLTLGNTIDLSAEDGKGGVKLTWTIDNSADKVYSIYQQGEGETTWTAISEKKEGTTLTTSTSKDIAIPNKPTVTVEGIENNKIKISQSATDNGSTYSFYAEAYDKTDTTLLLSRSNQVTGTITTGIKGYYYITDNNEKNDFNVENASYISGENLELDIEHNGEYVHIKAVDNAGNVSEETSALIWIESQATVDPNEGNLEGDENSKVLVGLVGKTVDLGTPKRTGYTFLGWSATAGTINGTMYTYALEPGIVTANWQINDYGYTVEYYYNGIKDKTATETGIATYMTQVTSYKSKNKAGYSFDTVQNLPLTITEKEEKNVIKVYYKTDQKVVKEVTYEILYYKDGVVVDRRTVTRRVQVLLPNKVAVDKNLVETNRYEDAEFIKTEPEEIPDLIESGKTISVYYESKISQVVVKIVDKVTGEVISEEAIEGKVGDTYSIEPKEIEGYTLIESPELTGTITEEAQEKVFYYAKNAEVKVKYLEKNTDEILSEEQILQGYESKEYTTEQKEIENYELVETIGIPSGTMQAGTQEVIYYYAQKTKVTVNHIDLLKNTILETETIEGKVGDKYTTTSKDIDGYVLATEDSEGNSVLPENAQGIMEKEEIVVNYYYKHVSDGVIVKHIDKINGEILDNETIEGNEGDEYTTSPKEFEGYDLEETLLPENSQGTMTKELIEVKYYYVRKSQVKVKYLDRNTNEAISDEIVIEGHEGDAYNTAPKEIEEYYLVESLLPENSEGTMAKDEIIVTYYYAKKSAGVIEKHINEKTEEIIEEQFYEGLIGDDYKTSSKEFEGYNLDKTKLPTNSEGKMTEELIEVNYYYSRKAQVKVEHIDEYTGEIIEQEIITGQEGDTYTTSSKKIKNYILDEEKLPETSTGIMTVIVNEDGTITSEIVVKYYYKKISAGVLEKHIDIKTNDVLEEKFHSGSVGDSYKINSKKYEEYDLVEQDTEENSKLPENAEGTMTEELIEVNYYYIRKSTVRVEYVDKETGKKISEDTIIEGHEDDKYKTEAKEIAGYSLNKSKLPENAEGTMKVVRSEYFVDEVQTETVVKYYYDKVKKTDESKEPNDTEKPSDNNKTENNNNNSNNSNNNSNNSNNNENSNSGKSETTIKIVSDGANNSNSNNTSNSNNNSSSAQNKTIMPSTGDIAPVISIGLIVSVLIANVAQVIISRRKK